MPADGADVVGVVGVIRACLRISQVTVARPRPELEGEDRQSGRLMAFDIPGPTTFYREAWHWSHPKGGLPV